jgi:DNA polymerase III delta prime subunit
MKNLQQHHQNLRDKLQYFYQENKIPHIIFHGSAGSGKKTLVHFFLGLIYGDKRENFKDNVMYVNCAQGKGIKFIREELKVFAKINIHNQKEQPFKSIVLLNADFLTIEGQSALRRCIEIFSKNTRFFIVVENKNKLLNPILSRFCEIYVSEFNDNGHSSIYQYLIHNTLPAKKETQRKQSIIKEILPDAFSFVSTSPLQWTNYAKQMIELGLSCLDFMEYIKNDFQWNGCNESVKINVLMHFHIIRSEHRCEEMLFFVMMEFLAFSLQLQNHDINNNG